MIAHPGPWTALVTLPLPPGGEAIARILDLEKRVLDCGLTVVDTVPAFNRLMIAGAPESWDPQEVEATLATLAEQTLAADAPLPSHRKEVVLPACYNRQLGPDLPAVAALAGLGESDVGKIHSGVAYTVLATGFAPGFAYLGEISSRIATPRLETPRAKVPAGSIGIADRRTAVYPVDSPGGWQLIGRVPEALFLDAADRLNRFEPGQRVRFRPIPASDFHRES